MRSIWQKEAEPCFDNDGRTIVVMRLIATGDGPARDRFVGVGVISNGDDEKRVRFEIDAPDLQAAFDRFDAARDAELGRINRMERTAKILYSAALPVDAKN